MVFSPRSNNADKTLELKMEEKEDKGENIRILQNDISHENCYTNKVLQEEPDTSKNIFFEEELKYQENQRLKLKSSVAQGRRTAYKQYRLNNDLYTDQQTVSSLYNSNIEIKSIE